MYNPAAAAGEKHEEVLAQGVPHLVNHDKKTISQKVGNEWHVIKVDFDAFVEKHLPHKKEEEPVKEEVKPESKAVKSESK